MRIYDKWYKELWWLVQEWWITRIRRIKGLCPKCGSEMYWWDWDRGYCTECDYKVKYEI